MEYLEVFTQIIKSKLGPKQSNEEALLKVCSRGQLKKVKALIKKEWININWQNADGETALHCTCSKGKGNLEIVKLLMTIKGIGVNKKNYTGDTPLHYVCWNGNLEVAEFLIEKGAKINAKNNKGETPLHFACFKGNLEIFNILKNKAVNFYIQNNDKKTALKLAEDEKKNNKDKAKQQNYDNIIKKLRRITDSIDAFITNHSTYNLKEFGEKLSSLIENGININSIQDSSGTTPLHETCRDDEIEKVKFLVEKGANVNAKNNKGKTPLDMAKKGGYQNIVQFLEKSMKQEHPSVPSMGL